VSAEDIAASLLLGFITGIPIFVATLLSKLRRSRRGAAGRSPGRAAADPRHTSTVPSAPSEGRGVRPLLALLAIDELYVFAGRLVLIAMVLYGAWVAPRIRWAVLGAAITYVVLSLLWRLAARWVGGKRDSPQTTGDDPASK